MAQGDVKEVAHKVHWWFECKSNSTIGLWHNVRFSLDYDDWRKNFHCTCAWSSTFGLDASTGLLTKPCVHIIACLIYIKEKYNLFDKLLEEIEQSLGINDENVN